MRGNPLPLLLLALVLMVSPVLAGQSPVPPIESKVNHDYYGHINVYSSLNCKAKVSIGVSKNIEPYLTITDEIVLDKDKAKRVEFTADSNEPINVKGEVTATHECINSSGMLQTSITDTYEVELNFYSTQPETTEEPEKDSGSGGVGGVSGSPPHTPSPNASPTPVETKYMESGIQYKKVSNPSTPTPTATATDTPTRTLTPTDTPEPDNPLQPHHTLLLFIGVIILMSWAIRRRE